MTKVEKIMLNLESIPLAHKKTILSEGLKKMDEAKLGLICIIDDNQNLIGLLTDGDLRRKLMKLNKPMSAFFGEDILKFSNKNPISCRINDNLNEVVKVMIEKKIWDLPVLEKNKLKGVIHLHDALKALFNWYE